MLDNKQQIQLFEIKKLTIEPFISQPRKHLFHEIIYVQSGNGTHTNHKVSSSFAQGDLFFISPNEEHGFKIEVQTEVYVMRFTDEAKLTMKEMVEALDGRAVSLSKAKSPTNLKVHFDDEEQKTVLQLCEILEGLAAVPTRNENLIYLQFLCLVTIIERNLSYRNEKCTRTITKKSIDLILNHIHKNIRQPELLTLKYIADKMGMSSNNLNVYFKKEMRQPIKQYIQTQRMELVEKLVTQSSQTLSEIAYEFNFVDESHFYKSFKKHFGTGAKDFRKQANHCVR